MGLTTMQRLTLAGAIAASAGALGSALFVQHVLGYAPCSLCLLARWPHLAVILLGGAALALGRPRTGLVVVVAAMLVAFAVSMRHAGVETGWLPLPESCRTGAVGGGLDTLRATMLGQTQPACDLAGPSLLGLSMARWHAVAALVLAAAAARALSRPAPAGR